MTGYRFSIHLFMYCRLLFTQTVVKLCSGGRTAAFSVSCKPPLARPTAAGRLSVSSFCVVGGAAGHVLRHAARLGHAAAAAWPASRSQSPR